MLFDLTKMEIGFKIHGFTRKTQNRIKEMVYLSRVINPHTPGKERNRLKRATALALREFLKESEPNAKTYDLVAFVVLALEGIEKTVELTTAAWEKRDYWIKADRFRLEWEWAGRLGREMRKVVLAENWDEIPTIAVQIFQQVGDEKISERHRMGEPWVGAWDEIKKLVL